VSALVCPGCGAARPAQDASFRCPCGELLEVDHGPLPARAAFEEAPEAGVWRFARTVDPEAPRSARVSLAEGDTPLLEVEPLARFAGLARLALKLEGRNPTGSFKDRGMTVAVARA